MIVYFCKKGISGIPVNIINFRDMLDAVCIKSMKPESKSSIHHTSVLEAKPIQSGKTLTASAQHVH
jgi:hypothetical protein